MPGRVCCGGRTPGQRAGLRRAPPGARRTTSGMIGMVVALPWRGHSPHNRGKRPLLLATYQSEYVASILSRHAGLTRSVWDLIKPPISGPMFQRAG
jgi:hypothetical protein